VAAASGDRPIQNGKGAPAFKSLGDAWPIRPRRTWMWTLAFGVRGDALAWVAVRDSGPGLDPEGMGRLFDAFYTTKPGGMGIGLSICRSIIEAHGGRIWASANVPQSAVFQFTLPVG
jgi:signal transduction histidine kinase